MKQNIKKYIGVLLFACLGLSSCESVLDVVPEGQHTLDDIFSNEVTTGSYLNSCYTNMPSFAFEYNYGTNLPIMLSDDAWVFSVTTTLTGTGYKNMSSDLYSNKLIADGKMYNGWSTSWNLFFRNIRRCNVFLSRIDKAVVPTEADRSQWKAEAKVLRAYYYMELITRFGGVPIVTLPPVVGEDLTGLARPSFKVGADFIIKECEEAMNTPELPWRNVISNDGTRMNKAIAAAIKSRTALFMASPLFCDGQNYWAEAERVTKASIVECLANDYSLYTEVKNPTLYKTNAYYEYITSAPSYSTATSDKESIWCSNSNVYQKSWQENGMPINSAYNAGLCPTQELVDAFPMKNGEYILKLDNPYLDEQHLLPNYNPSSGYDTNDPYKAGSRDPRFEAIIFYNGSSSPNNKNVSTTIGIYNGGNCGIIPGDKKRTCTGYYQRKYMRPDSRSGGWGNIGFRLMRLTELYLNYAEAAVENSHLTEAIAAIKPIRDRVQMPNINPVNLTEARLMIRNERRIEHAFEENRYNDNRRWTTPGTDMAEGKVLTAMWIEKAGTTYQYYRIPIGQQYDKATTQFINSPYTRESYKSKYLLHGLELSEANRLRTLTGNDWQNPGW